MSEASVIVAEVSTNWDADIGEREGKPPLAVQFERVISTNLARGYSLHSWRLSRVMTGEVLNETILAIFVKG